MIDVTESDWQQLHSCGVLIPCQVLLVSAAAITWQY